MSMMDLEMHEALGMSSGSIDNDGRMVPIVAIHFAVDPALYEKLENGEAEFNPENEYEWKSYGLTIRGARNMITQLQEAIDRAIEGPGELEVEGD